MKCSNCGHEVKCGTRTPTWPFEEAKALYKQGWSADRLAEKYRVTPGAIRSKFKREGFKLRTHAEAAKGRRKFDRNLVVQLYKAGWSVGDLVKYFSSEDNYMHELNASGLGRASTVKSVSPMAVKAALWEAGVQMRSASLGVRIHHNLCNVEGERV